ncbi:MAG: hypothetical protein AAF491_08610, partial [Verrucomicrobiota bacterium]
MNSKTCPKIIGILAIALVGICITSSQARTWTSTEGDTFQAIFLGIDGESYKFKMRDGKEILVPKERFIKADQEAAERLDLIGDDSFTKASARQIDMLLAGNLKEAGFSSFNAPLPDDLFVTPILASAPHLKPCIASCCGWCRPSKSSRAARNSPSATG